MLLCVTGYITYSMYSSVEYYTAGPNDNASRPTFCKSGVQLCVDYIVHMAVTLHGILALHLLIDIVPLF